MVSVKRQFAPCKHCRRNKGVQGGGLCSGCWRRPEVRLLHPASEANRRRGLGLTNVTPAMPDEPTRAIPGTPEKLAVMAARAEAGRQVFHPRDFPAGQFQEV